MSDQHSNFQSKALITGALASLAVIGSIFMYNRLRSVELQVNRKSEQLEEMMSNLEKNMQNGSSLSAQGNSNSSMIDAKINSVQQTVK